MKIHIIGASGAGKTYLAQALAKKYDIPCFALDDLFWDNSVGGYNVRRAPFARDAMLADILRLDDHIIEGVQYSWVGESFASADRIYLLDPPPLLCHLRIIWRFVKRKLTRTDRGNETFRSLIDLLRWTKKFYLINLPEIKSALEPYSDKVITLRTPDDFRRETAK